MSVSLLIRFFGSHADNLNLFRMQGCPPIKLEVHILQQKRPYFVAEPIGIEVPLQ
jgi:hypothetical protein